MDLFEYARGQETATGEQSESDTIYSVGQLTSEVKGLITSCFGQDNFWVKGELSNFRGRNQSGHMYFSLKDDRAVLNCVFFRNTNRNLTVELKDGLEILAFGRLDVWERGGKYQLVVEELRAGGEGERHLLFEQLKKKLEEEGLFAEERKKPLPEFPTRIGLVTSPTGAVIRDIIHVVRRRCPFVKLFLTPVKVQGKGAAGEIAAAILELNDPKHGLELLIVGRGGGSIEDLWAFNEEVVARAISESKIPVISAVGHQTDFTISDFVADRRAATPSQAGEIAVPNMTEVRRRVQSQMREMVRDLVQAREAASEKLEALRRSTPLRDPMSMIRARTQRFDLAVERMIGRLKRCREANAERLRSCFQHLRIFLGGMVRPRRLRFDKVASNLGLLNPLSILARGYSVVKKQSGKIVKRSSDVRLGDNLSVRLHEGQLACQVKKTFQN